MSRTRTDSSRMTQAERIVAAITDAGPLAVADLVTMRIAASGSASRACGALIERGVLVRVSGGGRGHPSRYGLRAAGAVHVPIFRGEVSARAETAYIAARSTGAHPQDAASELSLTRNAAERFEQAFRVQAGAAAVPDSSSPKFAKHDRHLADIWKAKGFPTWSERRGPQIGRAVVCLPITWPSASVVGAHP